MNALVACDMIVIGASVGGFAAVERLTKDLPADYPIPVVVVLHLQQDMTAGYLACFRHLKLKVHEAQEKERPLPGNFYVAPPGYHLLLETDGTFALTVEERVNYARPSIDVFFESAAEVVGNRLAGIILTGANYDGALGLKAIKDVGGLCFVQDPEEAEGSAMPEAALRHVQADRVATLDGLASLLQALGKNPDLGPTALPGAPGDSAHV